MNRREFLAAASLATAASLVGNKLSWAAATPLRPIGVQLYTLRDQMKADFAGTLKKVREIGFDEVEFAGYFDKSPKDVASLLKEMGLTSPSGHISYELLIGDVLTAVIDGAHTIGHNYIVNAWIPEEKRKTKDHWLKVADLYNQIGEKTQKAKIQFAYHNHWFEFMPIDEKGTLPFDLLLEKCDSALVKFELDLAWISAAGADPLKYFEKYKGRFPMVHLKDLKAIPSKAALEKPDFKALGEALTEVGAGVVGFKDILARAQEAGIKHCFVEHDNAAQPFESIAKSLKYVRGLKC